MGVPMIARQGTQDAIEVDRLSLGKVIDCDSTTGILDGLLGISSDDLMSWSHRSRSILVHIYTFDQEFLGLVRFWESDFRRVQDYA